jgi:outer membrane protein TolC
VQLPEDAGKDRPELHRKDLEAAGADAAIRAARAAALPTLSLTGTAGLGNTTQGVSNLGDAAKFDPANLAPTLDASVGLELTWNPFDLFRVRDAVAEARLAAEQVEAGRDTQKDQIAADLRKAAANVDALRQRVPLVDAQVALARDNLQIVQGLYAQGSATILDLFDAQSAFRQARTQGAALRVELATAECDLRWMLGEDLGAATGAQP